MVQLLRSPRFPLPQRPAHVPPQTWEYVCHAHRWYDRSATRCRRTYWTLKLTILSATTLVTILAATTRETTGYIAAVAAFGLLVEGIQQTGQFHRNHISYRLVSERIHGLAWMAADDSSEGHTAAELEAGQGLRVAVASLISSQNSDWAERMAQVGSGRPG